MLFVIYGVYAFSLPAVQPTHWDDIASSASTVGYIADNFRWLGMLSAMFGVLSIAVAYGGLRTGQRWAWFTLLSYPAFLAMAIVYTWPGLVWSPILIASVAALWLDSRWIFSKRERYP